MENESLKLYEPGEWILYAIGDYDLGIGQIVSLEIYGPDKKDLKFSLKGYIGYYYTPTADEVLCNISKQGTREAYIVWRARKLANFEDFCLKAKVFAGKAFDTEDRPLNYKLLDLWDGTLDEFLEKSENLVRVYYRLEDLEEEIDEAASKGSGAV